MQTNEADDQNNATSEFRQTTTATDTFGASDAAPLHDLTSFQRDVLRVIADNGRPGLRIKEIIEDLYQTEIHDGRLYTNLKTLINKGLVDKESVDGRTNKYSITTRGRREFAVHRNWMTRALDDSAMSDAIDVVGNGGGEK